MVFNAPNRWNIGPVNGTSTAPNGMIVEKMFCEANHQNARASQRLHKRPSPGNVLAPRATTKVIKTWEAPMQTPNNDKGTCITVVSQLLRRRANVKIDGQHVNHGEIHAYPTTAA
jgi:hypothetical protein